MSTDRVEMGRVQSKHFVVIIEDGIRKPLRYFDDYAEANRFATSEGERLRHKPRP